jgi:hypothetical protein
VATPGKAVQPAEKPAQAVAKLSGEARALIVPGQADAAILESMVAAGLLKDAVRFMPLMLPRREAAWWASQCVRTVAAALADPRAVEVLDSVEKWVAAPKDEARRAAFAIAQILGMATPAGCVGAAVFFSEGSLGPATLAEVPPPPHASPTAAASAVLLAAVISEPEKADDKLRRFVALGQEVAAGTNRWVEPKPAAPAAAAPAPTRPVPSSARPPTAAPPRPTYPNYPPPRR